MNVITPANVISSESAKPLMHIVITKISITLLPNGLFLYFFHRIAMTANDQSNIITDNIIFPLSYPM